MNDVLRTKKYWDSYYDRGPGHEWFRSYEDISDWLKEGLSNESPIIILGCGDSEVGPRLVNDGFENVCNVDFSDVVIRKMHERYPKQTWQVNDIRCMPDQVSNFYAAAIDKGTLDALLSYDGSVWDVPDDVKSGCLAAIAEIHRILQPGGKFLYCSFGQKHFRLPHLKEGAPWTRIDVQELDSGGFGYFLYTCTK